LNFMFIDKWLWQMFQGDPIAWSLFISIFVVIFLSLALFVVWWKMPDPAKRIFLNNLRGQHPMIADAYDDLSLKIETPKLFREGIFHDKRSGWHFMLRPKAGVEDDLTTPERDILTKAFRVVGTNTSFYLAYSGKGVVVNPAIQQLIEHEQTVKTLGNPGYVEVPKDLLMGALSAMKDKMIKIEPVYITSFLDARKIKEYIPKALTKSQLLSLEQKVREDSRGEYARGGMEGIILLMLVGVFILGIVSLAKQLGAF